MITYCINIIPTNRLVASTQNRSEEVVVIPFNGFKARFFTRFVLLIALIVVLLAAFGVSAVIARRSGPPPQASVGEIISQSPSNRPKLTSDEETKALSILSSNLDVQRVTKGANYEVSRIGPWTSDGHKLGASVRIDIEPSVDYSMNWHYIHFIGVEDGRPVYEEREFFANVVGITELLALIDLHSDVLVALQPILEPKAVERITQEETGEPDVTGK